ncbi:MAG: FeoA family protein [Antricoccus sp.]
MSRLSSVLSDRVIVSIADSAQQPSATLADLKTGSVGRILDVRDDTDPATARRLVDLGFFPGAEVMMVRRAPMADPVIYRVAGSEVALRRRQARCIRVLAQP